MCPHAGDVGFGAYFKVNQGFLVPMPSAFAFIERPAMYINHDSIKWVCMEYILLEYCVRLCIAGWVAGTSMQLHVVCLCTATPYEDSPVCLVG